MEGILQDRNPTNPMERTRVAEAEVVWPVYVKNLAIRNKLISKPYQLSGHTVAPPAHRILCVRFTSFVRQHDTSGSAVGATLDTGGWLDSYASNAEQNHYNKFFFKVNFKYLWLALPRPRLSPGKMRQAYLVAITSALIGARSFCARPDRACG